MNREYKTILMSFANIERDGRLQELYKICKTLGPTEVIDRKGSSIINYLFKILFHRYKCDCLVVDNRTVIPFALLFILLKRPKYIIQDCREMYFFNEQKSFKSKIGCLFEISLLKIADIIIVANKYRAKIMKKYYKLAEEPIVFENIRRLDDLCNTVNFEEKYKDICDKKSFKIISTSGFQNTPIENQLIKDVLKISENVELYFVGNNIKLTQSLNEDELKRIHFIGRAPLEELKFILQHMDIGYVGYEIVSLNTKYCASGKIYEYAYEKLPILAYKNIPLKKFIDEYRVGVCGDNFIELILELKNNYEFYKKNTLILKDKIEMLEKQQLTEVIQKIKNIEKMRS